MNKRILVANINYVGSTLNPEKRPAQPAQIFIEETNSGKWVVVLRNLQGIQIDQLINRAWSQSVAKEKAKEWSISGPWVES